MSGMEGPSVVEQGCWLTGPPGACPDIITNVEMERLADHDGPAGGRIVRPSDGEPAKKVEMYQDANNKKFGTNFHIPVVFYSQLMAVAFGMDPEKDAALRSLGISGRKIRHA